MAALIKNVPPASRIVRVSVVDADYFPYYFNCKDCNEPIDTEEERLQGKCEQCVFIDEMETRTLKGTR